jgi:ATP-dependent Clp protease ATP-binding subunit ClpC
MIRHSIALQIAWRLAESEALHSRQAEIAPAHFFLGLLKTAELDLFEILKDKTALSEQDIQTEVAMNEALRDALHHQGFDSTRVRRKLRHSLPRGYETLQEDKQLRRSCEARELFKTAEQLAVAEQAFMVGPLHLYASFRQVRCAILMQAIEAAGLDFHALVADTTQPQPAPKNQTATTKKTRVSLAEQKNPAPLLGQQGMAEKLGRDLTLLARNGELPPLIGRAAETKALLQTLLRSRKNNALLIGEAGVGKTGLVEGLAQRIAKGAVPAEFANRRIVEVSMAALVAGTSLRGEMEEKLQALIAQAKSDPDLILFIDEMHLVVGAGAASGSAMDVSNLLKPALARGEIRVIGATTTQEFRKHIEPDTALARRFEVIGIEEPSRDEALTILEGLKDRMERHHRIRIEPSALEAAVDYSIRYLPELHLPDKAIDVLDQACAQTRMQTLSIDFKKVAQEGLKVERRHVAAAIAFRCKVPVGEVQAEDAEKWLTLEAVLQERIKGQSVAITRVSQAVRVAKAGIHSPDKPLAVLLFAGPTGTGKTALAKALAECVFGGLERGFVRIDMSELMEEHSVSKLIGAPPGFVGHDAGGQLTEKIRSHPDAVLLLDEVEKAHPKVLDVFLQVFDTGFLTDAHGRRCDFRNHLIVMTTNLGAQPKRPGMGFQASAQLADEAQDELAQALGKFFRPEFINRITEIISFEKLSREAAAEILEQELTTLNRRLVNQHVTVRVSPEALDSLLAKGFNDEFGARHLQRTFTEAIVKPVALMLLNAHQAMGGTIHAELNGGEIQLKQLDEAKSK